MDDLVRGLDKDHIRKLIAEHTRQELRDEYPAIEDEVAEWRERYGVDSPDELEASIDVDEMTTEEAKERNWAANHWRENLKYRVLFAVALWRYDEWSE